MTTDTISTGFTETLLRRDFPALTASLSTDVALHALLPHGYAEWNGRDDVAARFARWFGGPKPLVVFESGAERVGSREHAHWTCITQHDWLGDGPFIIRQDAYLDLARDGSIAAITLLCSGFHRYSTTAPHAATTTEEA